MKMSETRIRKLAKAMAREMTTRGAVKCMTGADQIADVIGKIMVQDQRIEEEIEGQAREMLSRQPSLPPEGTGEYFAAFQQAKRAIAIRKGFKL